MTEATKFVPTFVTVKVQETGKEAEYADFYLNTVKALMDDGVTANPDAGKHYFQPVTKEVNAAAEGEEPRYEAVVDPVTQKGVPAHNIRLYVNQFTAENGGGLIGTLRVVRENPEIAAGVEGRFTAIGSVFPDQKYPKLESKDKETGLEMKVSGKVRRDKIDNNVVNKIGDHAPFEAFATTLREAMKATIEKKAEKTAAAAPAMS